MPGTLGSCGTRYSSTGGSSTGSDGGDTSKMRCCSSTLALSSESDGGKGTREPRLKTVPAGLDGGDSLAMLDRPPTTLGVKWTFLGTLSENDPLLGGSGARTSAASSGLCAWSGADISGATDGKAMLGAAAGVNPGFETIRTALESPRTSEPSSSSSWKLGFEPIMLKLPVRLGPSPRVAIVLLQLSCLDEVSPEDFRDEWTGGKFPISPLIDPSPSSSSSIGSSTT